jgi:drug/metabolite transporter (DMT)-like permease
MSDQRSAWASRGATALFVVLWSSGAIFARLGLDHASAFVFLALRSAAAFLVISLVAALRRSRIAPAAGTRGRIAGAGLLLLGAYSICYFLALEHGATPGLLATVLGAQPIVILVATERRSAPSRTLGLVLAVGGLSLVVFESLTAAELSVAGVGFALGALAGQTVGAIAQKSIGQPPLAVLPLQYAATLALNLACLPLEPIWIDRSAMLVIALLWLAIVISVVGQLLLYQLIRAGNLVNVTSLFYLVPIVTAAMDHWILGNPISATNLVGMAAILAGLAVLYRASDIPGRRRSSRVAARDA